MIFTILGYIWLILKPILFCILALLLKRVLEAVMLISRVNFYKNQKINTRYYRLSFLDDLRFIPFLIGINMPFTPKHCNPKSNFKPEERKDVCLKNNFQFKNKVEVVLIGTELIKEFHKVETKVITKTLKKSDSEFLGFVNKMGPAAQEGRMVLKQVFRLDKLKVMMPKIKQVVKRHVAAVKSRVAKQAGGQLKGRLTMDLFAPIVNKISYSLLLGNDDPKEYQVNGKDFSSTVVQMVFSAMMPDPMDVMTFGLWGMLGLNKNMKKFRTLRKEIKKVLKNEYNRRLELKKAGKKWEKDSSNLMDILITEFNEDGELPGDEEFDKLLGYMEIFQFAAADTTQQTLSSFFTLMGMSKHKKIYKDLQDAIKRELPQEDYTYDDLLACDTVGRYVRELMRLLPTANGTFSRMAVKDFKVGTLKVKKGDLVSVSINDNMKDESEFDNPFEFRPSRWTEEKRKGLAKTQYIPFSSGSRDCVGKLLAEFVVRLLIVEVAKEFNFELVKDETAVGPTTNFKRGRREINISLAN